jgi:hypothetical protein
VVQLKSAGASRQMTSLAPGAARRSAFSGKMVAPDIQQRSEKSRTSDAKPLPIAPNAF